MRRTLLLFGCGLMLAPAFARAQQMDSAATDSTFARAQRLVAEGQGDSGRAIIQRELDTATVGSPRYIEALYWRAVVAATAADAERDLRRIVVEYPVSPWSADALMRLAQLEMTRGESDQALAHLQRMITEHPENPARARANFWMARVLFEKGNAPRACARLADAVRLTPPEQVETRNQLEYLNQRCMGVDTTATVAATAPAPAPAPRETTAAPAAPPRRMTPSSAAQQSAPPSPATTRATGTQPTTQPAARTQYTVQVAAYSSKATAEQLRAKLAQQGYDARVVGTSGPFRVRVGRYDTRAAANDAAQRLRAKQMSVMVTEAEPR